MLGRYTEDIKQHRAAESFERYFDGGAVRAVNTRPEPADQEAV
jgi:hypothetical protein